MPGLSKESEENYLAYVQENISAREDELQKLLDLAREGAVDNKSGQSLRDQFRESIVPDPDTPYFIRVDLSDGEIRYYGGVKLNHASSKPIPESHKNVVDGLLILSSLSDGKGYTADYAENLPDLVARTRYDIREGKLVKYFEENLATSAQSGAVLAEEMVAENLQQTREKKMKPITSTLQPDQFRITREPISHSLAIQGPPGSGKTAVLLERLARIAYADQNVAKKGMLLIGPNKPFMEYVSQVLPSLGETGITLKSIDELSEFSKMVNSESLESDDVLFLKGSELFRVALENLVDSQIKVLSKTSIMRVADITIEFSPMDSYYLINGIKEEEYRSFSQQRKVAEARLKTILVNRFQKIWTETRGDIRTIPGDPAQLISQESAFRTIIRNMFPNIDPVGLLGKLKSDSAYFLEITDDICPLEECLAWISEAESQTSRITPTDVPILDYLDSLINDPVQKWGHIAIDEAQDLTPLELIMVSRRLDMNATVSLAGDLAQATGVQYYENWDAVLEELDQSSEFTLRELHTSYRVPSDVIEYARQFLELSEVVVEPSRTFLVRENSLSFKAIAENKMRIAEVTSRAIESLSNGESILIIAGKAERELIGQHKFEANGKAHASLLDPRDVKGLEFDNVIILNPDGLIEELGWPTSRLARLFYVLTTRSTKSLTLVGKDLENLKEPLAGLEEETSELEEEIEEIEDSSPDSKNAEIDPEYVAIQEDLELDALIREAEAMIAEASYEDDDEEIDDLEDEDEGESESDEDSVEEKSLSVSTENHSILELCENLGVNIQQASGDFLIGEWLFAGMGQIRCLECREKPQLIFIKHRSGKKGRSLGDHAVAIVCESCALIREFNSQKFGPIENVVAGLNVENLLTTKCTQCGGKS